MSTTSSSTTWSDALNRLVLPLLAAVCAGACGRGGPDAKPAHEIDDRYRCAVDESRDFLYGVSLADDGSTSEIGQISKSTATRAVVATASEVRDIAIDDDFVYWSDPSGIHRIKSGGTRETLHQGSNAFEIEVGEGTIFFVDDDDAIRARSIKDQAERVLVQQAAGGGRDLRVAGSTLYWSQRHLSGVDREKSADSIWRVDTRTGTVEQVATGIRSLGDFCVNRTSLVFTDSGRTTLGGDGRPTLVVVRDKVVSRSVTLPGAANGLAVVGDSAWTVAASDGTAKLIAVALNGGSVTTLASAPEGAAAISADTDHVLLATPRDEIVRVPR
jgi:hypothetical protein